MKLFLLFVIYSSVYSQDRNRNNRNREERRNKDKEAESIENANTFEGGDLESIDGFGDIYNLVDYDLGTNNFYEGDGDFGNYGFEAQDYNLIYDFGTTAVTSGIATTEAATAAPTTEAATEAPTTEKATEAPTTEKATEAPTTEAATEAPTTEAATEAPTTEKATDAPTTEAATDAPTTAQQTTAASNMANIGRPQSEVSGSGKGRPATAGGSVASSAVESLRYIGAGDKFCNVCSGTGKTSASTATNCMINRVGNAASECPPGNYCGVEVRMTGGEMTYVDVRCVPAESCAEARSQNFENITDQKYRGQCRPETKVQSQRWGLSTCRNCFNTCISAASTDCFDPTQGVKDGSNNAYQLWDLDRTQWGLDLTANSYTNV